MKKTFLILVFGAICAAFGYGASQWLPIQSSVKTASSAPADDNVLYWVAPMDSNFRRDQPGQSPMGMDLIPVFADQGGDMGDNKISVSAEVMQTLGVRTAVAVRSSFSKTINTVGYSRWDESGLSMIHPRVEGWLEAFNIDSVGDTVSKGQVLYSVYAPKLVSAQAEYLSAVKSRNNGLTRAAKARLQSLGFTDQQMTELQRAGKPMERLDFRATENAVVTAINARIGSYVMPDMNIASLAATDSIWLDAEVIPSQATGLALGQRGTAEFDGLPNQQWQGEISYIYPEIDATTRTLKVRLRFDNPELKIKPNMFARVSFASAPREGVLQIPAEAVIRAGAGNRVVMSLGDGGFKVVPVIIGQTNLDLVEVIKGLKDGDRVVTSGQFLIDSEANGSQALERLAALQAVDGSATVLGFPERGKIRLQHDGIASLDWPSQNRVFSVKRDVNLMPIDKQDKVSFRIEPLPEGGWTLSDIQAESNAMHGEMK